MKKITVRELVEMGLLGGATFAAKIAMSPLPNIEPVSLMVMLLAVTYGKKAIYPIYVYVLLELMIYGVNLWNLVYLYIWLLLAIPAYLLRNMEGRLGWAILSGGFGLLFGLLCAPVYIVTGGPRMAVSAWVSGIPYDVIHCVGNFIIAFVLFQPLRKLLRKLKGGQWTAR